MTIDKRIQAIADHHKLNGSEFAKRLDSNTTIVYKYLKGKTKPGYDFINKILTTFPTISAHWLLLGKGEMLVKKKSNDDVDVLDVLGRYQSTMLIEDYTFIANHIAKERAKMIEIYKAYSPLTKV